MITSIISYCSLDERFLKANIIENLKFSNDVIIVYYDHLMNGEPENNTKVKEYISNYNNVSAIQIQWDSNKNAKYHHNLARWIGYLYAKNDWLLFLDCDEIPDGNSFLEISPLLITDKSICTYFSCYWYFRKPEFRSLIKEECGLLIFKNLIDSNLIFSDKERWNAKHQTSILCQIYQNPIFHHYSWVRTKEEMEKKVMSWAHKSERNWLDLINKEFQTEFSGKDFIHGYAYENVENFHKIII